LRIRGGQSLSGEVRVSGAKNAALPILCASLLTHEPLRLTNVPRLMDVATMARLLVRMGVEVDRERPAPGEVWLRAAAISEPTAARRAPISRRPRRPAEVCG